MENGPIYQPRGKAREYSVWALNIYKGCPHGCVYCYVPSCTYTNRENFATQVMPRPNIIWALKKQLDSGFHTSENVLLCFTCDPYPFIENEIRITRSVIIKLTEANIPITILTKSGMRAVRDFDLLSENSKNAFAVTLTFDDPKISKEWEPGATVPAERIQSLRQAKTHGIQTWVSFEPVIDPNAVYHLIDQTYEFVDFYKVGKLNYHPHAKTIDWPKFRNEIKSRFESLHKPFLLKKDLLNAT